jgi:hypothetical protein
LGWPLGLLTTAAVIAGLAYLVISLAPNYIARYLVRTYFQGLAIDASGVETIDINPLRGEINFGPVTFRGAEGETGQVGRIGVKIDVTRLLHRQALLNSAVVEGIRIDIRQAAHGEFSVNGIPLTRILAERAARRQGEPAPAFAPSGAPPEVGERRPWGRPLLLRRRERNGRTPRRQHRSQDQDARNMALMTLRNDPSAAN